MAEKYTLGVEEEFHLIDPKTEELREVGPQIAQSSTAGPGLGQTMPEMLTSQIELTTPVCTGLDELHAAVTRRRQELAAAARAHGAQLVASGTYPCFRHRPAVTPSPRYEEIADRYGLTAREQAVCSCHIHVGVADPELVVAVMNRARPWLAVLLALSANSPFWQGEDTGYASYRSQIWNQWPVAGPPRIFSSYAEYETLTQQLLETGVLRDRGMLYWDVRPSEHVATIEFRVCDVPLQVEQTVMLAGLFRALTARCVADERSQTPLPQPAEELVRAARWRAARSGLAGELINPCTARPRPASHQVHHLMEYLSSSLHTHGDYSTVTSQVAQTLQWGTGADRQLQAYRARSCLRDVLASTTENGEA